MDLKKNGNYFIRYMMIVFMLVLCIFPSVKVSAKSNNDKTLAEMREELKKLKAEKADADSQKEMSEAEKTEKNYQLAQAYESIEDTKVKIEEAKKSIEETGAEISRLDKQTRDLMEYYQILQGNNTYMEFITDSSSMTDLIMRADAVSQLSEYNQEKLVELENLIKENEQKQVDLTKYQDELNDKVAEYQRQLEEIDSSIVKFTDIAVDIDGDIEFLENSIKEHEDKGCKENESLNSCIVRLSKEHEDDTDYSWYINNNGWLKPVTSGRISSLFGWRSVPGQSSYHSGIDIAVSEGTKVYPAASGVVIRTVSRSTCGGNQIYIQSVVNGQVYTTQYAHLLQVNVKVGDTVDVNDVIALSGGKSTSSRYGGYDTCTTGAHLHFGVSAGAYTSFADYTANLIEPPGFPGKGASFYSRTQWFD